MDFSYIHIHSIFTKIVTVILASGVCAIDRGLKYGMSSVRLAKDELRQTLEILIPHHLLCFFFWLMKLLQNIISSLRKWVVVRLVAVRPLTQRKHSEFYLHISILPQWDIL